MHDEIHDEIKVALPARTEFIHILRAVTASVAAGADFSVESIDDLRLVIDEACGQVLRMSADARVLTVDIKTLPGLVELQVSTDGQTSKPMENLRDSMAWVILSALSDSLQIENGKGPGIRVTKRIGRDR